MSEANKTSKDSPKPNHTSNEPHEAKQQFIIEKWEPIVSWSWKLRDDTCAICRTNLNQECINCQVKPAESCDVTIGTCSHAFHVHCLEGWLMSKGTCPMCNLAWDQSRLLSIYKELSDEKDDAMQPTEPMSISRETDLMREFTIPNVSELEMLDDGWMQRFMRLQREIRR